MLFHNFVLSSSLNKFSGRNVFKYSNSLGLDFINVLKS